MTFYVIDSNDEWQEASPAMKKFYVKLDKRKKFANKLSRIKNEIFDIHPTRISDEEVTLWAELEKFDGEKFSIAEVESVFNNIDNIRNKWRNPW